MSPLNGLGVAMLLLPFAGLLGFIVWSLPRKERVGVLGVLSYVGLAIWLGTR